MNRSEFIEKTTKGITDVPKKIIELGKRESSCGSKLQCLTIAVAIQHPDWFQENNQKDFMNRFGDLLWESLTDTEKAEAPKKVSKKGVVSYKFRSWPVTKVRWQYMGYIFNAAQNVVGYDKLFPVDGDVPTMKEIRKLAQKPKTDLEKFRASLKTTINLLQKVVDGLSDKDEAAAVLNEYMAAVKDVA